MFYIKTKITDDVEVKINLYDDEIYTTCPKCGKEMQVTTEDIKLVFMEGDFSSSSLLCEDCSSKWEAD